MIQRCLANFTNAASLASADSVGEPVFCRFALLGGPFDQQPFFGRKFASPIISMSHSDPQCCKARMESLLGSLAPGNIFPRARRQRLRQLFHGNGLMVFVPAQQCWRASPPFPTLRGQRSFSMSPYGRGFLNTDDILQTKFGEPFSKLAIIAIGGIGQHGSRCDFFFHGFPNLLKRDRRLGDKGDLSRNARLLAAFPSLCPNLWQVQAPRNGQTGLFGRHR